MVYADSGAFIALLWRRDRACARVRDHYTALREAGDVLLTSDLVVSETATRLAERRVVVADPRVRAVAPPEERDERARVGVDHSQARSLGAP